MINREELTRQAAKFEKQLESYFRKLKPAQIKTFDTLVHKEHERIFSEINCLDCAMCCKYLGPRLTRKDVAGMARNLRMKDSDFEDKYTRTDEDGDIVFNSLPCPFLGNDNYCMVYNVRPKACREYPHTEQAGTYKLKKLHVMNIHTCPALLNLFQNLVNP